MTQLFMGGSPISLDLHNIFGSTLEPVEALILGTFLKFDKNDDGLLQLHEFKHALDYLGLPGKKIKAELSKKQIVEIDLKTLVLIIKFLVIGTDNKHFNEEISEKDVAEILEDSDFVMNTHSESDSDAVEKVDFNKFIDIITKPYPVKTVNPDLFSIDDSVPTPVLPQGGNKKSKKTIYKKRKSTKRNTRQSRKLGGQAAEVKELSWTEKAAAAAKNAAAAAKNVVVEKATAAKDATVAAAKDFDAKNDLSGKAAAAKNVVVEKATAAKDATVAAAKEVDAKHDLSGKAAALKDKGVAALDAAGTAAGEAAINGIAKGAVALHNAGIINLLETKQ